MWMGLADCHGPVATTVMADWERRLAWWRRCILRRRAGEELDEKLAERRDTDEGAWYTPWLSDMVWFKDSYFTLAGESEEVGGQGCFLSISGSPYR